MLDTLRKLFLDTRGATAIEYGMLVALIAITLVGVFNQLGSSVQKPLEKVEAGFNE